MNQSFWPQPLGFPTLTPKLFIDVGDQLGINYSGSGVFSTFCKMFEIELLKINYWSARSKTTFRCRLLIWLGSSIFAGIHADLTWFQHVEKLLKTNCMPIWPGQKQHFANC